MNDLNPAATYSMLLTQVIATHCRNSGIPMAEFHQRTGISQPSWSRLSRGQTRLDVEDLKTIESELDLPIEKLVEEANQLEQKVTDEGIQIIEPYTTQKKTDLANMGVAIVAGAVLGFLAAQVLKK